MGRIAISFCLAAIGAGAAHAVQKASVASADPFGGSLRDGPLLFADMSPTEIENAEQTQTSESLLQISAPTLRDRTLDETRQTSPAYDGAPDRVTVSGADALRLAQELYERGEFEAALKILAPLRQAPAGEVDKIQVDFLLGMIAMTTREYRTAVDLFRGILDEKPELVRIRLELARALFELKEDRAAAYHFRLALADDLPLAAQSNIKGFLALIERRKTWRVNAQIAAAPDSNVSAGPKDRTVELFGLPFELDDNAARRSGIGLSTSLNAEYFPKISEKFRLELRGGGSFSDYENADFDDLFLFAEAGPRYVNNGFSVSTLATYSRRFFGNEGYRRTIGGKLNLAKGLTSRTIMNARFSGAVARYDLDIARNGPIYSGSLSANHVLDKISSARLGVGATREQTDNQDLRNTQYILNAAYRREMPLGVTLQAGPDIYFRRFDNATLVDNNVARRDWTYGGSVYLTKRDWRFYGFAPVFSYQYLNNVSNVDRFDYVRHRANVGLTRVF